MGFGPATGPTLKTALCHIRALVGRNDKYRGPRGLFFLSSCWVAFGRPFYLWTVLPDVPRHWRVPPASGGHPPRLIPISGGGYCLEPQKGECRRGRRYFWPCRTRVGFGPATGPTLKTALCHIRALVGRNDKYRGSNGRSRVFVCGLSSPVLGLHSVGHLTSGRFCRMCLGTGDFLQPQGATRMGFGPPPRLIPQRSPADLRGVGFIAWRLRRPKKGNADGAEGIFGLAGHVWASALRPGPP